LKEKKMAELKYSKYIVTDLRLPEEKQKKEPDYNKWAKHLLWLDNGVIEGASFFNSSWYFKPQKDVVLEHTHDFDEIVCFFGTDPNDPYNLGGEIEFWLEDEKHVIQNSCIIWIPKGLKHCPQSVTKVERPIFHVAIASGAQYSKSE
jgi:quercetin dioxygenase-like cupin family protein